MSDIKTIKNLLKKLSPKTLEIKDQSHKHKGHAGWKEGVGTHFDLFIISEEFKNKSHIVRHRMVNALLKHELESSIHALSIKAYTPDEFR